MERGNMQALATVQNNTLDMVQEYEKSGKLNLPKDYSAGNALKSAYLMIQDNQDLMQCSMQSIAKAMLDMCILGLNPAKAQGYFIAYGNEAKLSVSYFGKIAIAKRIDKTIENIIARAVRAGEEFEFETNLDGTYTIKKHTQTLESLNSKEFIAGYATIFYNNGKKPVSLIMPFSRIKESWKMSKNKPIDENGNVKPNSVHGRFTEDMIKRTLINAITKPIINTSNDEELFDETLQTVKIEQEKVEANEIAKENTASEEVIDVDYAEIVDAETGEILE